MIVLKKKKSMLVLFSAMALAGFAFLVLDMSTGGTYLVTMSAGAVMGAGIGGVFSAIANFKCYAKFFEQEREMTISEIASELGRTEKKVIADLGIYTTNKKDIKLLKNCEGVKFVK